MAKSKIEAYKRKIGQKPTLFRNYFYVCGDILTGNL